jgi:hypothetical protein
MKKLFFPVAVLTACTLAWASLAGGEGFGTPTMDGIPDGVYGAAEAIDPAGDGAGNANMDLLELYVCNDASYWYFCFTINDDINATNWGKYLLHIDIDGIAGSGSTSPSWARSVTFSDPHLPEYGLNSWVDNPPYDPSHTQFFTYSGGWSSSGQIDAVAIDVGIPSGLEWKIDKTRIGDPDSIWCEVFSTGGGDSDNARDTANDPADDWNGTEGQWSDMATLAMSTLVHYVSGSDVTAPQAVSATATDFTKVRVTFNEAMNEASATNAANYTIPGLSVTAVDKVSADTYSLTTDAQTYGIDYTVTVAAAVQDLAGNPIDPAHDEVTFTGFGVAQVTFLVDDTGDMNYAAGYRFKGSWDTNQYHAYDPGWGLGQLYDLYDDGTNGDETAGDHIWTAVLDLVPDGGTNSWQWGVTQPSGEWIDGNWQFQVTDTTDFELSYTTPAMTEQDVAVVFSVDMSAETAVMPVIICGNTSPLTWNWSPDNPDTLNDEGVNGDAAAGDNIWTITLVFPTGTQKRVEYKYGNGGADNDLAYGVNRIFFIDDDTYSTGNPQILPTDTFGILTGVEEQDEAAGTLPAGFSLLPNYPNPFNPKTVIAYRLGLQEPAAVSLKIYNLLGQQVRTLSDGVQASGEYQLVWDGRDDAGRALSSGIYFVRLQVGDTGQTRKLILTR